MRMERISAGIEIKDKKAKKKMMKSMISEISLSFLSRNGLNLGGYDGLSGDGLFFLEKRERIF